MSKSNQTAESPSIVGPRPADKVIYEPQQYHRLKVKARNLRRRGWSKDSKSYQFYKAQDWETLWEEFCSEIAENGRYKYGSVSEFMRAKFKSSQDRKFARWVIGTEPMSSVPWLGNWALERFLKHWRQDARVKAMCEKLALEVDAQKAAASTADLWADNIGRIVTVMAQVDELYGGQLFLEGLSKKANQARAKEYREWMDWGMDALAKAVNGMVEALGGKQQISMMAMQKVFEEKARAASFGAETPEQENEQVKKVMESLVWSVVERGRATGTPMPLLEELTSTEKSGIRHHSQRELR
jgi:hypothetical protein